MSYLDDVSKRMAKSKQKLEQNRLKNQSNLAAQQENENQKIGSLQRKMQHTSQPSKPIYSDPSLSKRKKYIKSAITAKINTTGNARSGKSYFEEYDAKKGGYWHTYDNGRRVFVAKHKTGATTLPKKKQTGGTYQYLNRSQSA